MRKTRLSGPIFAVTILATFFISGCASTKTPIFLHPEYANYSVESIYLLPVVDRRIDKTGVIDLEKEIREPIKKSLEKKGYEVFLPAKFSDINDIKVEYVSQMDIKDASDLGPLNAKNILLVYVDDVLDSYAIVAYQCKIEATGSLIEKSDKIELWRDKGIGSSGQGGLISGPLAPLIKLEAISNCIGNLFVTLPDSNSKIAKKQKKTKQTSLNEVRIDKDQPVTTNIGVKNTQPL